MSSQKDEAKRKNHQQKQYYREWKEKKILKKLKIEETNETERNDEPAPQTDGVRYTVSIAVPGSILDNAQSPELRTLLAGQIGRAAAVFNVDEVVIYDEFGSTSLSLRTIDFEPGIIPHSNIQLARILQYMECPQYLRKSLFPMQSDLTHAGLLPPLDCPHHVRQDEICSFREGVVSNIPSKSGKGSFANCGLHREVRIDKSLQPGVRVTVRLTPDYSKPCGTVVSPWTPRAEAGLYWGYTVRLAHSIGSVLSECPYPEGYDLTIGTSDKGNSVDDFSMPSFRHLLIVFGGLTGIEAGLDADQGLKVSDPNLLFSHYLNTCPSQGSRTIRTEEAVLITLTALQPKISQLFSHG